MQRSRFRSLTSLVVTLAALPACSGDDECGTRGASSTGLLASSADVTLEYGNLTFLAANDCPVVDPSEVVSLSIEGKQTDGSDNHITFCIPRPDLLSSGPRTIGTALSTADIRIIDLTGELDGCTYRIDSTRVPTGQGVGLGVCDDGTHPNGFALDLDAAVSLRRTCGTTVDTVGVTLTGRVAVTER